MSVIGGWLHSLTQEKSARVRLVCFPHAGGVASSFRSWSAELPPCTEVIAVQYPGRANRLMEAPVDRISTLAHFISLAFRERPPIPTVFFGHSMGGLVAFETARLLEGCATHLPRHLVLSAHPPPHVAASLPPIAHLPDAEFLRELDQRYAAIPAALMHHPDVLALLLPALRADLTAVEHRGESTGGRVTCPITAFAGREDRSATRPQMSAWQQSTSGFFELLLFPGGHFFIESQREAVIRALSTVLNGVTDSYDVAAADVMGAGGRS